MEGQNLLSSIIHVKNIGIKDELMLSTFAQW